MKSLIALTIQFLIVASVGAGVWFLLRFGEERASNNTAPAAPGTGEVQPPAALDEEPAAPAVESDSVAKEEHAPPELS